MRGPGTHGTGLSPLTRPPPHSPPPSPSFQWGECTLTTQGCGPLCQKDYSAHMAPCAGNPSATAPPDQATLPRVELGQPCGAFYAACETGCCNQLNYCSAEDSVVCTLTSCDLAASPASPRCAAVHKAARAGAKTHRYKWIATWGKAAPDGYTVDAVFINGKYPAPTIYANAGDRVIVEYVNLLGVPSTIHWHGLKQVRGWVVCVRDGRAFQKERNSTCCTPLPP